MTNTSETRSSGIKSILRSLRSRNYRLFFTGQSVSVVGTWMQQVAMRWLVYRLTGSAFLLGVIGFTSQILTFLLAPFAGVLADRWNRRRLLIITQALALLQATILAAVVLTGVVQVWQIVLLSLFLGAVNAFEIPVRHSFVVELIDDRKDLGNAIAMNASMVQVARLIGPAIAGLLVVSVGEGVCFTLNSLSYLAILLALVAMKLGSGPHSGKKQKKALHELKEGFQYAFGSRPIRSILLLVGLTGLIEMLYVVLVPVFAKEVLHGDANTFGFLMAAIGCGALIGTYTLASRKSVIGLDRMMVMASLLFGGGIAIFAISSSFFLSLVSLLVSGFGAMILIAASNTILQTILEEDKRGRVMSLFTMSFIGMAPFGSFLAGIMSGIFGPRNTVLIGAVGCLGGGLMFAMHLPKIMAVVRPIYAKIGIIEERS